ncbi:MAG: hypothetical protein ACFCGT_17725 [Sandaracinaceae bacterium]
MKRFRRVALVLAVVVVVLVLGALLAGWLAHEPRPPTGRTGDPAEELAGRMESSVDLEAWGRTGAITWTFAGRRTHLWDRERGVVRVVTGGQKALLYAGVARGRAYQSGREARGPGARELLETAHEAFINDSFWLNPIAKLRDDGVTLSRVEAPGPGGLLVEYASGGVTPGDAYLWIVGDDGRPIAWRMWVSIIPIGGVRASWEGWRELPTGAWVATTHRGPLGITLALTDLRAAATLEELLAEAEPDPFAPLFE